MKQNTPVLHIIKQQIKETPITEPFSKVFMYCTVCSEILLLHHRLDLNCDPAQILHVSSSG